MGEAADEINLDFCRVLDPVPGDTLTSKPGPWELDEMSIRRVEKNILKARGRIQLPWGLVPRPLRFAMVTDNLSDGPESRLMKSAAQPGGSPAIRRVGLRLKKNNPPMTNWEPGSEFRKVAGSQDAWVLSPALGRKWGSSGVESGTAGISCSLCLLTAGRGDWLERRQPLRRLSVKPQLISATPGEPVRTASNQTLGRPHEAVA
ncbi:uncharacterized protein LOC115643332 [Gopherus evgoodei]|uniref:uncharacterized protein LOC115643332 n=1 Tax=Gopherus evgoodei TaxID=1825980 RepID=UPI0011D02BD0|nr:uncharacterized protein LOC115643332 [Gopherus evgoodei]